MTKSELYNFFLSDKAKEQYLYETYNLKLQEQLNIWVKCTDISEKIIKATIFKFIKKLVEYEINTDCLIALIGCMHISVLEFLEQGLISIHNCNSLFQSWYLKRTNLEKIPKKQMNIILSQFSRKMFDYFIDRYYYIKNIPYNEKIEKKIAKKFEGKGNLVPLYKSNNFHSVTASPEAYIQYVKLIDPFFIDQIGTGKPIYAHPDSNEHYLLQRISNQSQIALPFILIIIVIVCILAYLELNSIISLS